MTGDLVPRHLLGVALEDATGFRVVVLNGPRQAGKSTLLQLLQERVGGELVTLDDRDVLRAARTDPTGFVTERKHPLLIDEVQRGGNPLVLAVKADVDRHPRDAGRFFLTGSSRFLTVPTISESLAGRVRILDLWPFSQGELRAGSKRFLDSLFSPTSELRTVEGDVLSRAQLFERVVLGGFPAVHDAAHRPAPGRLVRRLRPHVAATRSRLNCAGPDDSSTFRRLVQLVLAVPARSW